MKKIIPAALIGCLSACFLLSCKTATTPPTQDNSGTTLTAFKLASDADAPDYNSSTLEPCWSNATGLITLNPEQMGMNFSGGGTPSQISIQSVVSSQNIYFLVQYDDPTANLLSQPLHFHGGNPHLGTNWTQDVTFEDGVSLVFEMIAGTTGSSTFASNGCSMLCHTVTKDFNGLTAPPGMYAESVGRYDMWFWHAGKSNGSGYADDDVSIGVPDYALQPDDNNAEIYDNNVISDNPGFEPYLIAGGGNRSLNKQFFIAEETAKPFTGSSVNPNTNMAWATDDIVPAFTLALPKDPSNDYFDVHAKGYYSGGKWTVKFQRKLNTGNTNSDVQFASGNTYLFSFAVHNNNPSGDHYGISNKSFTLKIP